MAIHEDESAQALWQSPQSLEHRPATSEHGFCQVIVMQLLDELGLEEFELA